jgi:Tfp pilus assembly protein PilZ
VDTTGKLYRSIKALKDAYPSAQLYSEYMCFIKNAAIITASEGATAAGGAASLVLEVLPIAFKRTSHGVSGSW